MTKKNQETIMNAVNTLCDPVKATLGTKGRTVLYNMFIADENKPHVSKDGASIARHIISENGYENMVISVLRESSLKTMLSAGDGTTTTCILAQEFISKGYELMNSGVSYYEIAKGMDEAVKDIKDYLLSNTTYVNDNIEALKELASISANDENIGELIFGIIKEIGLLGNIKVEKSMLLKTKVDTIKGMKVHKGWLDPFMCNNIHKETFEADNVNILIVDGTIRDWNLFAEYFNALEQQPLLVFCDELSDAVAMKLKSFIATTKAPICFVKNDGYGDRREMIMEDVAIITGGTIINSITPFDLDNLGFAESVSAGKTSTSILGGDSYEKLVEEKIKEISELLESDRISSNTEMSNMEKLFYQRRLANYAGGVSVIHVGGRTEIEIKELKDRIDDAVLAVESAVRDGISYGGGYTFLKCKSELEKDMSNVKNNKQVYKMVLEAIESPFKQLLINSDQFSNFIHIKETMIANNQGYDLRYNKFIPLESFKVFDATAVLMDALENSAAVAKSLLSVKELVYDGIRLV